MNTHQLTCKCEFVVGSSAKCTMGTSQCCWCSDKRTIRKMYVDKYGLIEPEKYYCPMPQDLYYCKVCRRPETLSIGIFMEKLKQILPEPSVFHDKITKEKNLIRAEKTERMQKRITMEREHARLASEKKYKEEYEKAIAKYNRDIK